MELKSLLVDQKTVSVEYPDPDLEGFIVDVAYISRETLQKIRNKCLVSKFDKRSHQLKEEVDDKLFLKLYVEQVISGWKGLKMKYLESLLPVEIPDNSPEELEYTEENALTLMQNSVIFDQWITGVVSDLNSFRKAK